MEKVSEFYVPRQVRRSRNCCSTRASSAERFCLFANWLLSFFHSRTTHGSMLPTFALLTVSYARRQSPPYVERVRSLCPLESSLGGGSNPGTESLHTTGNAQIGHRLYTHHDSAEVLKLYVTYRHALQSGTVHEKHGCAKVSLIQDLEQPINIQRSISGNTSDLLTVDVQQVND